VSLLCTITTVLSRFSWQVGMLECKHQFANRRGMPTEVCTPTRQVNLDKTLLASIAHLFSKQGERRENRPSPAPLPVRRRFTDVIGRNSGQGIYGETVKIWQMIYLPPLIIFVLTINSPIGRVKGICHKNKMSICDLKPSKKEEAKQDDDFERY
jgi:hypothetical protein